MYKYNGAWLGNTMGDHEGALGPKGSANEFNKAGEYMEALRSAEREKE